MAVLEIERLGSSALREKAVEVQEIDDSLRELVQDMFETMDAAEGIGLAGPQIGVNKRLIVVDVKEEGTERLALFNPHIAETGRETEKAEEGCLSIPGVAAPVERPLAVTVEALGADGHPVRISAEGLLARCLQHEIDHLDGVLFVDRLSPLQRNMLLKKYRALQAEEERKDAPDDRASRSRSRRR